MMMKPVISENDYRLFKELLASSKYKEGGFLGRELMNASVLKEEDVDEKTIRLNSYVEVEDIKLQKVLKIRIVLPDCVDLKLCHISVFAPLSVALLGYREKDIINWSMPAGQTRFSILKVQND
jgi:regulator of nucleoside diphosphate kinase